jgi:hypothetical protein
MIQIRHLNNYRFLQKPINFNNSLHISQILFFMIHYGNEISLLEIVPSKYYY